MPELPEVEVSRMGITPHVLNQVVTKVNIHNASMRWPVPDEVYQLEGLVVSSIERRAKYLLLKCELGSAILHLGMSGNLRVVSANEPLKKHDHVEFILANNKALRLNDPRRFGCCLWQAPNEEHKLLAKLGPEPLTDIQPCRVQEDCPMGCKLLFYGKKHPLVRGLDGTVRIRIG